MIIDSSSYTFYKMGALLIYGATGYTGRLITSHVKNLGLNFIVAGRDGLKVADLGESLDVPSRIFDLENEHQIDTHLNGIRVLLNCAGPFMRTAKPLTQACIRNGVHYLDIAAELDSYHLAERYSEDARAANVMLLPGCGGSVAMLGCLAAYATDSISNPVSIDVALHVAGAMSRGSAISAAENMTGECLQRLGGKLVNQDATSTALFDFDNGNGEVQCFPVTLPDLITIEKATSALNIRTFVHVSGDAFPDESLDCLPDGPTKEQRERAPYHASVCVTSQDETSKRAVLHTVNGYTFTAMASAEAARRVLAGEVEAGFQTPAGLFGPKFVYSIAESTMILT